jgi:murein DD-endopeptidase MepM/ murein hydrolase activator NlpD
MNRVVIFAICALPVSAVATPVPLVTPRFASESPVLYAKLADAFGLPFPNDVIEPFVRLRRSLRDAVHDAFDRLASIAETGGFRIPDLTVLTTEPVENSESSGFGWREDPIKHIRKFHNGADLRGKAGTPVLAAGDGVVIFSGEQNGYGNCVFVDHGGGVVTRYAHLRRIDAKLNAAVIAGQRVGQVGSTGRTTGPHLHFEVRLDGRPVDPPTAMTVAELERESPIAGRIASFALSPALQADKHTNVDPPKKPAESRPERRGRSVHVRPVS